MADQSPVTPPLPIAPPVATPPADPPPADPPSLVSSDNASEFKLERYKYILQQMQALNENTHRYLTLFQTLATAIVGGGVGLFLTWSNLGIAPELARAGIRGLLGLLVLLMIYVVLSVLAGIFSWMDYRNEEVDLLDQIIGPGFRKRPSLRSLWRWYETYILLFMVVAVLAIYVYVERQIIPLVR